MCVVLALFFICCFASALSAILVRQETAASIENGGITCFLRLKRHINMVGLVVRDQAVSTTCLQHDAACKSWRETIFTMIHRYDVDFCDESGEHDLTVTQGTALQALREALARSEAGHEAFNCQVGPWVFRALIYFSAVQVPNFCGSCIGCHLFFFSEDGMRWCDASLPLGV